MNVAHPYHFDSRGRTAEPTSEERHIRDLLEQLIFTAPGERVNRPTFGSGVLNLVFAGNSPELASAAQLMIQGALQQWLAELVLVEGVRVVSRDAELHITVGYVVRRTQERRTVEFRRATS
jgi:phage baseplate assembly protein W